MAKKFAESDGRLMTPFSIISLILTAVEELEKNGIINIGGWGPAEVDGAIEIIKSSLSGINGGMGGQTVPPGESAASADAAGIAVKK